MNVISTEDDMERRSTMNEFATMGHAHSAPLSGLPEVHPGLAAFQAAVRAAGGRAPRGRNGPKLWSADLGWHERDGGRLAPVVSARPGPHSGSVRTLEARQRDASRDVFTSQIRADEALVVGASAMAWRWARQFAAGGALTWGATGDERIGWELHQRGFHRPPLRVHERQLAQSMR